MRNKNVERTAWRNAKARCLQPNHRRYPDYGGRGITFYPPWLDPLTGFSEFYDEFGPRPSPAHSLGRINNDLGYQPGNLEWQTRQEQAASTRAPRKNRLDFGHGCDGRKSVMIPHDGRVQSLVKWAEELGMKRATLYDRLIANMEIARALNPQRINARTPRP